MLVSAIGKFNTFTKSHVKSCNSFESAKLEPKVKVQKTNVKTDLKTSFTAIA